MVVLKYAILALCIWAAVNLWIMGGILEWISRNPLVPTGGMRPLGAITIVRWFTEQGHKLTSSGRTYLGRYVQTHHPVAFSRLERIFVP